MLVDNPSQGGSDLHFAMVVALAVLGETQTALPPFSIESVTVNEPVSPAKFLSETSSWDESDVPQSYVQHVLHLAEPKGSVLLGKENPEANSPPHDTAYGMDPGTLQLYWVLSERILSVSWRTHSVAGGRWVVQALVLLERTGEGWREAFRDYHDHYYRGGWDCKSTNSLSLVMSESEEELVLVRTESVFYASERPRPLTRLVEDGEGRKWHHSTIRTITEWPVRIENGRLACSPGTRYLGLGETTFPAEEIAKHLLSETGPNADDAPAIDEKVRDLVSMNPDIQDAAHCTGRIKVGSAPPYQPHGEHRWRMQ
jgi:hypothetical protein